MDIVKSRKYLKSLEKIPKKYREEIEAEVDRLETDLTGVLKIQGTRDQARLDVGDYRVFLLRQKGAVVVMVVQDVVRRTTTTYRKKK
jgi:mRNA-degrading endonuclease RelE of RelBE toxin-antitoxin system